MSAADQVVAEASKKPVSPRQLRANRRNAQRSTGPRTEPGKARSSQNATAHGLFCKELLLPGEDSAELRRLRHGLYVSQSPQDALERELVDRIVAAQWRLRRIPAAERVVLVPGETETPIDTRYRRALDRAWRAVRKTSLYQVFQNNGMDPAAADEEIDAVVDADRHAAQLPPQRPPGELLAHDFSEFGAKTVDRLSRYRQRLELSVHRALRELRQLRKDRAERSELPPCPYLHELDDDDAADHDAEHDLGVATSVAISSPDAEHAPPPDKSNVQNEPISGAAPAGDDAAEGCERPNDDRAHQSAPIVMHHPISVPGATANPRSQGRAGDPVAKKAMGLFDDPSIESNDAREPSHADRAN